MISIRRALRGLPVRNSSDHNGDRIARHRRGDRDDHNDRDTRAVEKAADWLLRLHNDDMSIEEITEWQCWLEAHPENRSAFDRLQDMWSAMDALPTQQPPAIAPTESGVSGSRYRRYAIAATLVVCVGVAAIIVSNVGLLPWASLPWIPRPTPSAARAFPMTAFQTAGAEHRNAILPDGSHLALGAKSLVSVRYADNEREVILDHGEAYFEVAKDPTRPFRVHAGSATVTAVGTAFNVRRSGELVEVAVAEGVVKVDHDAPLKVGDRVRRIEDVSVRAGYAASIDPNSLQVTAVRAVSTDTMASWRNGRLEYLDRPLKFVIDDVNRYAPRPIIIGDPAVGELRLTGTVFERDIDAWLRSVADLLPVKVERDASGIVVLRSAAPADGSGPRF
jgi:transmembrane sensor